MRFRPRSLFPLTSCALNGFSPRISLILIGLFFFLPAGCGGPLSRSSYWVAESMVVQGQLASASAEQASGLTFSLIDPATGARSDVTSQVTLGPATGQQGREFQLNLPLERMAQLGVVPLGQALASMGFPLDIRDTIGGRLTFERRPLGFYDLEIYGPPAYSDKGNRFYSAFVLPVLRSHAAGTSDAWSISVGSQIALQQAGTVLAKVINESGQPLENARVMAWSDDGFELPNGQVSGGSELLAVAPRWPAWFRSAIRPVIVNTNASGTASVFPVTEGTAAKKFALAAWAPGHCLSVKTGLLYNPLITADTPIVALKSCEGSFMGAMQNPFQAKNEVPQWTASWEGHTGTLSSEPADRLFLFTNSSSAKLTLVAKNAQLRPIRIKVFEGSTASGEARSTVDWIPWGSHLSVDVPTSYTLPNGQKSENGLFTVTLSSALGATDASPLATLYGSRSTVRPTVDASISGAYKVLSALGIEGVVSALGSANLTFSVQSSACQTGMQMGVLLGELNTQYTSLAYSECVSGVAQFKVTDVISSATGTTGGTKKLKIFLKDKYGNTSENSINAANWIDVYADLGIPDLSVQAVPFQLRWGLAPAAAVKGTDTAPYGFGNETLSAALASGYVLRFAAPGQCLHDTPSSADGTGALATQIVRFGAVNTQGQTVWSNCGDDLPLGPSFFSVSPSGNSASLALVVQDAAGHTSLPYTETIPTCPATPLCWQP